MTQPNINTTSKQELRTLLRKTRKDISLSARTYAAERFVELAKNLTEFKLAQTIGVYLNSSSEAPTNKLIDFCHKLNKTVFAPIITDDKQKKMLFSPFSKNNQPVKLNRFGLSEPVVSKIDNSKNPLLSICSLDIVFMPLLGFDRSGCRIGMGGGYYDRALANKKNNSKPFLVGLAFDEQEQVNIPNDSWDVPIECIITPKDIIRIKY